MTRFLLSSLVFAFLALTLGTGCGTAPSTKQDVPTNAPAPPKDKPATIQMQ